MQSQYATTTQVQQLAITPAAYTRFENASPGCTTAALQAASSLLDSFLAGQFVLPLQTTPTQGWDMSLVLATCAVAAKLLYDQFGYNPSSPVDALIQRRYEEQLSWATKIRDKEIQPQWIDSSGISSGDQAGDFVTSDAPVGFTGRGSPTSVLPMPPFSPWDGGL
jgi:phage gp36-like protein